MFDQDDGSMGLMFFNNVNNPRRRNNKKKRFSAKPRKVDFLIGSFTEVLI